MGARLAAGRRRARRPPGGDGGQRAAGRGTDRRARPAQRRRAPGARRLGRAAVASWAPSHRATPPWWLPGIGPNGARRRRRGGSCSSSPARCATPCGSTPSCRRRRAGVRAARAPPRGSAPGDDRALRRIRGLLAKAESTEFPEEAESLTAKAQELMTRHAVDAALLDAGPSPTDGRAVDTRRVHVQDPYVRAKMQLLGRGRRGQRRPAWSGTRTWASPTWSASGPTSPRWSCCSRRCCCRWPRPCRPPNGRWGDRSASRSFRRSFLLGYAHRIGERLQTARRRATAEAAAEHDVDLLPVLRSRAGGGRRSASPSSSRGCAPPAAGRRSTRAVGTPDGRRPSAPTSACAGLAPLTLTPLTPRASAESSTTLSDQQFLSVAPPSLRT